jgi:hypothetical protein
VGWRLEGDGDAVAHLWGLGKTGTHRGVLSMVAMAQVKGVGDDGVVQWLGRPALGPWSIRAMTGSSTRCHPSRGTVGGGCPR